MMPNSPPSRRLYGDKPGEHYGPRGGPLSSSRRGYDRQWTNLRAAVVARHPLCIDCKRRDVTRPTEECHHVVPIRQAPARRLDVGNVAPLCRECHERWEADGPPEWWEVWVCENVSTTYDELGLT